VFAHQDDINAVAFADKSCQTVFSGSDDTLIKVWDRRQFGGESNGCVGVLQGHKKGITFIDSKMDGRYLISNGKDHCIKLWDLRKMTDPASMGAPGGARPYHGHYRYRNRNIPDQSLCTYAGHSVKQTLIRCRFSPMESTGQRYIYTGSGTGTVWIYDLLTGKVVDKLKGHDSIVRDLHWHPCKPELVTTGWDNCVKKWHWDEDTMKLSASKPPQQDEPVDPDVDYWY